MNMDEFLKAYCTKSRIQDDGCKRSQGLTIAMCEDLTVPEGFKENINFRDHHFRRVWLNDKELITITYCEGDIIVMQHSNQASYNREIVSSAEFYKTH